VHSPTPIASHFWDRGGLSADLGHRKIRWSSSQFYAQNMQRHPAVILHGHRKTIRTCAVPSHLRGDSPKIR
jgi:hypothetical protein